MMGDEIYLSKLTKRFRVTLEESWQGESSKNPERRWLEIIECCGFKREPHQTGPFICLFCETPPTLQLYTNRVQNAKKIWNSINRHPGTRADFHLDGEAELFFPPSLLPLVAQMAGARKRRQLSETQKEAMALGREKAGLIRDEKGRIVHSQTQNSIQGEVISAYAEKDRTWPEL
jgi:hypothetical protein